MSKTVLICDDEAVLRALVRDTLESELYTIVEARNGDECLELASSVRPDLVVLDMMMPGRSGLEVLSAIRADAALTEIPVVMLTARAQAQDRQAALAVGADHYLPKPFSPLKLLTVVEQLLDGADAR